MTDGCVADDYHARPTRRDHTSLAAVVGLRVEAIYGSISCHMVRAGVRDTLRGGAMPTHGSGGRRSIRGANSDSRESGSHGNTIGSHQKSIFEKPTILSPRSTPCPDVDLIWDQLGSQATHAALPDSSGLNALEEIWFRALHGFGPGLAQTRRFCNLEFLTFPCQLHSMWG
jgi:hypothetical protein